MRKIKLFVICLWACAGLFAQEENMAPLVEYTNITTVVEDHNKTNLSRIDNIKYSIEEYESMIDRCKELTDKLISHDKKIRKGSLNKNQYRAWQRDLVEAKMLNLRIDDYNAKLFEQDGSFMNNLKKEALSNYYDFSKALEISKNYAGL